jgi:hypothetical protein
MPVSITDLSDALSTIVENTGKSVVRVDGGRRRSVSGVVWSPKQVVTVAHGVQQEAVTVSIGDQEYAARVKGRDESTDLALLELDEALPPATFDDGAAIKVGQLVLRLARPGETVRATSGILNYALNSPEPTVIVATEPNIIHQMQKAAPHKNFIGAPGADGNCGCNMCPYMALNTMEKLYLSLRDLTPQIEVPEDVRVKAKRSLDRMLEMAGNVSAVPVRGD